MNRIYPDTSIAILSAEESKTLSADCVMPVFSIGGGKALSINALRNLMCSLRGFMSKLRAFLCSKLNTGKALVLRPGMYVRIENNGVSYNSIICDMKDGVPFTLYTCTLDGKPYRQAINGGALIRELTHEERQRYFDMLTGESNTLTTSNPIIPCGEVVISEDGIAAVLATDLVSKDETPTTILHFDMNRQQKDTQDTPCVRYRRARSEETAKFWALVTEWIKQQH